MLGAGGAVYRSSFNTSYCLLKLRGIFGKLLNVSRMFGMRGGVGGNWGGRLERHKRERERERERVVDVIVCILCLRKMRVKYTCVHLSIILTCKFLPFASRGIICIII